MALVEGDRHRGLSQMSKFGHEKKMQSKVGVAYFLKRALATNLVRSLFLIGLRGFTRFRWAVGAGVMGRLSSWRWAAAECGAGGYVLRRIP